MKMIMETENSWAMFLGNFWVFLLIFSYTDNMLPSKLTKIYSFIVDPFLINNSAFKAKNSIWFHKFYMKDW